MLYPIHIHMLLSITNKSKPLGLSCTLSIITSDYPTIKHDTSMCCLVSIYSKKPEPISIVRLGRNVPPVREKKSLNSFLHVNGRVFYSMESIYKNLKCKNIIFKLWTSNSLLLLSGDVEKNPGPEVTLVTQNCRGLKKETKFRQLLNSLYKTHRSNTNVIIALQETHLDKSNLKYQWKGPHIITPGNGYQGGCITLLGENMEVVEYFDIDSEAHVAKINILESTHISTVIVANVHAPCPHNQQKVLFFKKIRDIAEAIQAKEENDCKLIILGDFNLTFDKS